MTAEAATSEALWEMVWQMLASKSRESRRRSSVKATVENPRGSVETLS